MKESSANLSPAEPEIPLSGGRVTQGVVRVGNTVRRPVNPRSSFIHSVLLHLEKKGVACVPRYLGQDEKDREVITFLSGICPPDLGVFSNEQIGAAMGIVRQCHDALLDFPGCGTDSSGGVLTVCHNDLSPCNFLFTEGSPTALIDWDAACIASPLDDLAYAAWLWLDLGNEDIDAREDGRRIDSMLRAYLLAGNESPWNSCRQTFCTPDCRDFLSRIRRQMQRVGKAVFPSEEQTNATRRWAASCENWLISHSEELIAGMMESRG